MPAETWVPTKVSNPPIAPSTKTTINIAAKRRGNPQLTSRRSAGAVIAAIRSAINRGSTITAK